MTKENSIRALFPYFFLRGRAGRWEWFLTNIFPMVLGIIAAFILGLFKGIIGDIFAIISIPVFIVAIWAVIAVTIRRLHDLGFSGWWAIPFFLLVPLRAIVVPLSQAGHTWIFWLWMVLGIGIFLVLLFCPGNKGENRYGLPPKQTD